MARRKNSVTRWIGDMVDDTKDFVDDLIDRAKDVEEDVRDAVKKAVDDDEDEEKSTSKTASTADLKALAPPPRLAARPRPPETPPSGACAP
jgi:hypothetical protein